MTLAPPRRGPTTGRHAARPAAPAHAVPRNSRRGRRAHRLIRLRRTLAVGLLSLLVMSGITEIVRAATGWHGASAGAAPAPTALAEVDTAADAALASALSSAMPESRADTANAGTSAAAAGSTAATATPAVAAAGSAAPAAPGPPVVVEAGDGQLAPVEQPAGVTWTEKATGRLVRVGISVEGGLGVDGADFAGAVLATLGDERGWQTEDNVRFRFVSASQPAAGERVDLTVVLASPTTTDRLCAPLSTAGQVSCNSGGRAVINARRWLLGVPWFDGDLTLYRQYVVNHEVGHGLGHGHTSCRGVGRPSPVMAQQTLGLKGCTPWAWPTNDGV